MAVLTPATGAARLGVPLMTSSELSVRPGPGPLAPTDRGSVIVQIWAAGLWGGGSRAGYRYFVINIIGVTQSSIPHTSAAHRSPFLAFLPNVSALSAPPIFFISSIRFPIFLPSLFSMYILYKFYVDMVRLNVAMFWDDKFKPHFYQKCLGVHVV